MGRTCGTYGGRGGGERCIEDLGEQKWSLHLENLGVGGKEKLMCVDDTENEGVNGLLCLRIRSSNADLLQTR